MEKEKNQILVDISNKKEIEISKELRIRVTIPKEIGTVEHIKVLFNRYGEDPSIILTMQKTKEDNNSMEYCTNAKFEQYGNYYFFFSICINGVEKSIKISRKTNLPFITDGESPYWRILVIQNNFNVPEWAKDALYYQIFVDRFYNSKGGILRKQEGRNYRKWGEMPDWKRNSKGEFHNNDFFGGDIKGIEEKLDYLKSLSVTVIYMSPINESLYRYERYASTNHLKIDPDAGTYEDLDNLHKKANAMGIHLVLDVAFNHCSSDNPIFQEALNNPNSKYRDWFYFHEDGSYECWYKEFKDMPILNQNNQEVQQYIYGENGVIDIFSKYVDGYRVDVAEELKPFFLEGMRKRANQNGLHLILGECWNKVSTWLLGKSMDCSTNYPFANAIYKYIAYGEDEYFKWQINDILESYPQNTIDTMVNSLDTHDIVRALTIFGGKCMRRGNEEIWKIDQDPSQWHMNTSTKRIFLTDEFRKFEYENDKLSDEQYRYAKDQLKIAVLVQYFLPGNPCIFYGTEVGLHGYKDPFNRKCFPWDDIDEELLMFYQEIGKLRSKFIGQNSDFNILSINKTFLVYEVSNKQNKALIVVNRGHQEIQIEIPEEFKKSKETFSVNSDIENAKIQPFGGFVILK